MQAAAVCCGWYCSTQRAHTPARRAVVHATTRHALHATARHVLQRARHCHATSAAPLHWAHTGNDALRAVQSVQHRLGAGSSVVLIQNGVLAVYQVRGSICTCVCAQRTRPLRHAACTQELWAGLLQRMAHRPRVIVGSITHGAYMHPDGQYHVVHAGRGGATWAEVDPALPCLTHPGHSRM